MNWKMRLNRSCEVDDMGGDYVRFEEELRNGDYVVEIYNYDDEDKSVEDLVKEKNVVVYKMIGEDVYNSVDNEFMDYYEWEYYYLDNGGFSKYNDKYFVCNREELEEFLKENNLNISLSKLDNRLEDLE